MPPKSRATGKGKQNPDETQHHDTSGISASAVQQSFPTMLATTLPQLPFQSTSNIDTPANRSIRPRLPPLSSIPPQGTTHYSPITYSTPHSHHAPTPASYTNTSIFQHHHPLSTHSQRSPYINPQPPSREWLPLSPSGDYESARDGRSRSYNPLKRPHESSEGVHERSTSEIPLPYTPLTSEMHEPRPFHSSTSVSSASTPTTAAHPPFSSSSNIPPHQPHATQTSPPSLSTASLIQSHPNLARCKLHIRQQPRAARAGPDGKDRRPIDPPPVLQLLMTDFDPNSPIDMEDMTSQFWVVHCRLVSANSPRRELTTLPSASEDVPGGSKEVQRLLLGTAVASPHHTRDDPDPKGAVRHPTSSEGGRVGRGGTMAGGEMEDEEEEAGDGEGEGPPSPSSRFFSNSNAHRRKAEAARQTEQRHEQQQQQQSQKSKHKNKQKISSSANPSDHDPALLPGLFFIFADLSVRKAGDYRLEFRLMRIVPELLQQGSTMPILDVVASDVFKVVNAKDFDQVKPSTELVKGLLERGAGFPLKLKKGMREVGRRRGGDGEGEGEEGEFEDEEGDEEMGEGS